MLRPRIAVEALLVCLSPRALRKAEERRLRIWTLVEGDSGGGQAADIDEIMSY